METSPKGRKGCTRRLAGNQLASHLKSLQVSRLSCILNTLDLKDMVLDLGHISVACLVVPVENKSKNNRMRTEKERETSPIWRGKKNKENKTQVYSFAIHPSPIARNLTNPMYHIPAAQNKPR